MALQGKVFLITGATRGIGFTLAEEVVRLRGTVCICCRHQDHVDQAVEHLQAIGAGPAWGMACDTSHPEQVECLIRQAISHFGRLDVVVNNAAIGFNAPFAETTPDIWDQMIATNLSGYYYTAWYALEHLRHSRGTLVNIGSLSGKSASMGESAYAASKFAITGLSEALLEDLARQGIRLVHVMPGTVNTTFGGNAIQPREDQSRLQPEHVARAVLSALAEPHPALETRIEIQPLARAGR